MQNISEDRYNYSNQLIKEATRYKKSDIERAISLIKKALKVYSPSDYSYHFKLANYLSLAGKADEAFSVYAYLLKNVIPDNVYFFNRNLETIYAEICKHLYKEKDYSKYIYYYCLWLWNNNIAHACQGHPNYKKILDNFLIDNNKLRFLAPKQINNCFKKLNQEEIKSDFNNRLFSFFQLQMPDLKSLYNISYNIQWVEVKRPHENEPLCSSSKFMKYYNKLNSIDFHKFYIEQLGTLVR
jgi:hypothetical protein